ncbi:MAG: hypothetical protein QOF62_2346 [Pyrinomonadaceae bacterium]|jgi:hypothetical protein|nr:hypothetical protein [Pyrinomonadaceae bacterium]
MATTSIIVELLIIGFFTIVWISLWSVRLAIIDLESLKGLIDIAKSTPGLMFITALSYQLGVVMNGISYRVTRRIAQSKYRDQIDPPFTYEDIIMKVRQNASEEVNRALTMHLSVVRLTRAGMVNFSMIAVPMFLLGGKIALAGIVPLFIAGLSAIGWRRAYRGFYSRVAYGYHEVTGKPIKEHLYKVGAS